MKSYVSLVVLLLMTCMIVQQAYSQTTKAPIIKNTSTGSCFTNLIHSTIINAAQMAFRPFIGSVNYNLKYSQYLNLQKPDQKPNQSSSQWTYRELIYQKNVQQINSHNLITNRRYNKGINKFTDLQQAQFIAKYAKLYISSKPITAPNIIAKPPTITVKANTTTNVNTTTPKVNTTTTKINSTTVKLTQLTALKTNSTLPKPIPRSSYAKATTTSTNSPKTPNITLGAGTTTAKISSATVFIAGTSSTTPESIMIDWSCKATPVINQGQCGSCYIIAPLQTVSITYKIYNQSILPLSIQQVLSCGFTNNGLNSCDGGYFNSAYDYMQVNGTGNAIMYPYDSSAINLGVIKPCNTVILENPLYKNSKTFITGSAFIPSGNCAALVQQLKKSAISVSIAAQGLQFYLNGTFSSISQVINHGVTLVGYDPINEYKIKNSWGTSWGNSGYAYLSESVGVCQYAMYPITGVQGQNTGPCC